MLQHVLINLNGHTAGDRNGISALRPAPLQLAYLAFLAWPLKSQRHNKITLEISLS